jgi:predicted phage tail protein
VSLGWTIPATRENGQALSLSELSGYEIYYVAGATDRTVVVSGGSVATYRITGLAAGSYTFAISAVDTSGAKSALSAVVVVNVGQ